MTALSGSYLRKLLCLAAACACAATAVAAPVGPTVLAGSASYNPASLSVTSTSTSTQISWRSFNVAAGEVVRFIQPDAHSVVLNRVFDPQSLSLRGGLSSNGSVFFLSNGRLSGMNQHLDLAGLIATSLRLPRTTLAPGAPVPLARIRPLTVLAEGSIYVIGADEQALTRANGDWVLNPGRTVELAHAAMLDLRVELSAPRDGAINLSRLVGAKGAGGIFAGLFRIPAAAHQATQDAADAVFAAAANERASESAELQRFYRYALLYAQLRREWPQAAGGTMRVASATEGRMLAAAKSRPSILPREIEIGTSVSQFAHAPHSPRTEVAATLEPQPIAGAAREEPALDRTLQFALASGIAAGEMVATLEPQPVPIAPARDAERGTVLQLALAATPAKTAPADAPLQHATPPAPAAVVAAVAPQRTSTSRVQYAKPQDVLIERRAPRYFTDYRGAMFFM